MSRENLQDGDQEAFIPLDPAKEERILSACVAQDLLLLQDLAVSHGGLLNSKCRAAAWPILLGCGRQAGDVWKGRNEVEKHHDEEQVRLDVNRSFVYQHEDEPIASREAQNSKLFDTIITVLRRHPMLHYFQGYHDIVQVLVLVLDQSNLVEAASRLSLLRIRDYMLPTMAGTEVHLNLLPHILSAADPVICAHLSETKPFFALTSTLTLYAHDVEDYDDIARLFDFLLASEASASLYLFAAIVISRRDELLDIAMDDTDMLHFTLSKLPRPFPVEKLIEMTIKMLKQHPLESLPWRVWSMVPSSSVLKTTRNFYKLQSQTLEDGEEFFEHEAAHLQRVEHLKQRYQRMRFLARRYRRPIAWTGAAMFVAVLGILAQHQQYTDRTVEQVLSGWGIWYYVKHMSLGLVTYLR